MTADVLSPEQRRRCMQSNKSVGTRPEVLLCRALWKRGWRYRRNVRGVPGTPDICFKRYKVAVFVDGEFWHGRDWEHKKYRIKSNRAFWYAKIERNIARDQRNEALLLHRGWQVVRIWDSEVMHDVEACADRVETVLRQCGLERLHRVYRYDVKYDDIAFAAEEEAPYGE